MDKERLKGKNVLITGAAQGMGAAIAEHYCAQGAKVCITDVNLDGCKEVEERIRSAGGEAISCKLDVRKREDHVAAVHATVEAFGSLNVSLNNAGVNKPLWFMDVTEENYDFIFDINVRGAWLGMQEQARQMIKQGKQKEPYKILHVASILSRETFDDVVIYGASKHAVAGLIKGGAKGLAEYGINVNGYGPGVVRTEMWEQLDKEFQARGTTVWALYSALTYYSSHNSETFKVKNSDNRDNVERTLIEREREVSRVEASESFQELAVV